MSAKQLPRLHAVSPTERAESAADAPTSIDVLRFATLAEDRRALLLQVSDFLEEIDFGTVVLVMHDGKVTQIETSEKIRLSRGLPRRGDTPRSD
jgi:hypothetical protein